MKIQCFIAERKVKMGKKFTFIKEAITTKVSLMY